MNRSEGPIEVDDDDEGAIWRDVKRMAQAKRADNRQTSASLLKHHGIAFASHNFGAHLIVTHGGKNVDFWPGTGKWVDRDDRRIKRRGVFPLLKYVGVTDIEPNA